MSKTYIRTALGVLVAIFLLVGGWDASTAQAEVAKTTKNTRMMERRGEKSRVLLRVPSGKTVKVLARQGRWVKVRYQGRSGWVTRSSLTASKNVRRKRRRPFVEGREKKRDFSGTGPSDRVGADVVAEDEGADVAGDEGQEDAGEDVGDGVGEEEFLDEGEEGLDAGEEGTETAALQDEPVEDDTALLDDGDGDEGDDIASTSYEIVLVKVSKAELHRKPTSRSPIISTEFRGARLMVLKRSKSGKWLLIENPGGDQGWVRASVVGTPGFSYPKSMIRAGGRAGYTSLTQVFASDGANELANYSLSSGAASVAVGGDLFYRLNSSFMLDVDLSYTGSYAAPGIQYNYNGQLTETAFMMHEVNVGVGAGYNFNSNSGMVAYARAGYHFDSVMIQDQANFAVNAARLPSESLHGPTLGVHLDVPHLSGAIGLRVGGDAILPPVATRAQTPGLMDGDLDSAFAAWGSALVTYQLSSTLSAEAGYRFAYAKSVWTGPSQRTTGALNESARQDITHLLSAGVSTSF